MAKLPEDLIKDIADRYKRQRLSYGLTPEMLAERSGVSFNLVERFESTGEIELESLLKLARALNALEDFETLFTKKPTPNTPKPSSHLLTVPKKYRVGVH